MDPLDRAWIRACGEYRKTHFRNAYMDGARAAHQGLPGTVCPYKPRAGGWGKIYWSAWMRGYRSMP